MSLASAQFGLDFYRIGIGSPGEIRTRVGGSKALYPCPLDDRAPETIQPASRARGVQETSLIDQWYIPSHCQRAV